MRRNRPNTSHCQINKNKSVIKSISCIINLKLLVDQYSSLYLNGLNYPMYCAECRARESSLLWTNQLAIAHRDLNTGMCYPNIHHIIFLRNGKVGSSIFRRTVWASVVIYILRVCYRVQYWSFHHLVTTTKPRS